MQIKPVSYIPTSNNGRKPAEVHVFERDAASAGLFEGLEKVLTPVATAVPNSGNHYGSQAEHAAQLMADHEYLAATYLERQMRMNSYTEQDNETRSYTVSLSA